MALNISQALELIADHHAENQNDSAPQALYSPRNYIMSQEGKRMRSVFCLLGYSLYDDQIDRALDLAYCVELFHNFTLVHDDIMDAADLRRGAPSVFKKFGTNAAILSGDVMLIEVYDRLTKIDLDDKMLVLTLFNQVAREVCEGQSMDMSFETNRDVSIAEYLEMIRLKTAVLLGVALRLGALQAGASISDQEHLQHFGVNAGIAFQLQDDYLDVYGDPKKFGKKVGGDIIQGKKSYLYLRALKLLEGENRSDFESFYENEAIPDAEKVSRVTAVFDELYIGHYCNEAKQAFFDLAKSHLDVVEIDQVKKDELIGFAEKLMNRDS